MVWLVTAYARFPEADVTIAFDEPKDDVAHTVGRFMQSGLVLIGESDIGEMVVVNFGRVTTAAVFEQYALSTYNVTGGSVRQFDEELEAWLIKKDRADERVAGRLDDPTS